MKVELFTRRRFVKGPLWYFRVRAGNGEILIQSEGYSRRVDALSTVHGLMDGLPRAQVVDA